MRSRGYVFTVNNYLDSDIKNLDSLNCRYLVYGKEVGENLTPHLQGFILFKSQISRASISKKIPRAYLDEQKGTNEEAILYCKKEGNFKERGEPPISKKKQGDLGKRTYEEAWSLAKEGKIEDIHPGLKIRYWRTLCSIEEFYCPKPKTLSTLDHQWYYGNTGTGKSRKAREENPDAYIKSPNKWWDDYQGEDTVIIEEWSPVHQVLASHLKTWCDHYAFRAERKGGSMLIRPKKIIITSNYSIPECFELSQDSQPILRRFHTTHFNKLS